MAMAFSAYPYYTKMKPTPPRRETGVYKLITTISIMGFLKIILHRHIMLPCNIFESNLTLFNYRCFQLNFMCNIVLEVYLFCVIFVWRGTVV